MKNKRKVIISLSGGMDSATVLATAIHFDKECIGVGFCYGSKHNEFENQKAKELAEYYKIPFKLFDLEKVFADFNSNLLKMKGEIPEGHYEHKSMKLTIVPGRNLIFISILAGYAEAIKAEEIWIGIHAGDHAIYPDCRPAFYHHAKEVVRSSTEGRVFLAAPFLQTNKTNILRHGTGLKVPYDLTRTCYKNQSVACGKCGSCQERLEAFANLNITDPIKYEGNPK